MTNSEKERLIFFLDRVNEIDNLAALYIINFELDTLIKRIKYGKDNKPHNILGGCFLFSETPQGYSYWWKIRETLK